MNILERASTENCGLALRNCDQLLSNEIDRALLDRQARDLRLLSIRNAHDLDERLSAKFRDGYQSNSGDERQTFYGGKNDDAFHKLNIEKSIAIGESLKRRGDFWREAVSLSDYMKLTFPKPAPIDHSFWWANTWWTTTPGMTADSRADGLHFFGGPKVNDYNGELHTSFGATARFALQEARLPASPTGLFVSSPHVELFGGLVAFAPDWDLIQGNGIASCNMVVRQTIFQFKFGQSGPVASTVAEAISSNSWKLYLKNTGYSRHGDLPGFMWVPPVQFGRAQFGPGELWSEIEVRFDIYLNTTGALVWCEPEVLLRHFQWPLTPIA